MGRQPGFFDVDGRLREISAKGDDLERIAGLVDFEMFRPELERAVPRSDGSKGGRPAFDHVLMFKVLMLQAMHSLSDERCEYLIRDRLSFMRFLGLGLADPVPDANTIWTFREALKRAGAVERAVPPLRCRTAGGRLPGDGRADRRRDHRGRPEAAQHRSREGRDQGGPDPRGLEGEAGQAAQKDRDARWTVKFSKAKPRRGRLAADRHRGAGLRLQEPRLDRPPAWADPQLDGNRCRGA